MKPKVRKLIVMVGASTALRAAEPSPPTNRGAAA
jgi:hypothetical protein